MLSGTTDQAQLDVQLLRSMFERIATEMAGRAMVRAWPVDESGRSTFLKIPASVDLASQQPQRGLYGGKSSLTSLPPELHCAILSYLPAVDRICLALTCKSLAASAMASTQLRVKPWTPWLLWSDDTYPTQTLLKQRLAHGWFDKSKYRYCSRCQKIRSRDPEHFQATFCKRKRLPYSVKVHMPKEKWRKLNTKKRYEHIINTWCTATHEDHSFYTCDQCRDREVDLDDRFTRDIEKVAARRGNIREEPVECPVCIEHSLTNTYKQPHKPKVRPFLWKWTKKTFSFFGNAVLVVIYLIYLFFKMPVDVGIWLWKRYKTSRAQRQRSLWCFGSSS